MFTSQPLNPNEQKPETAPAQPTTSGVAPASPSPESQIASPAPQIYEAAGSFFKTYLSYILGAGLLILLLIVSGVMLLSGGNFSESGVVVALTGPEDVTSGTEIEYEIRYLNATQQDIEDASLRVAIPADVLIVATDSFEETSVWQRDLGTIIAGTEVTQKIKLMFVGAKDDVKLFRATLQYSPQGVKTRLTQESNLSVRIKDVPLAINVKKPSSISANQDIEYVITYKNQTSDLFYGSRLRVAIPDGFTLSTSEPQLASGQFVSLDDLYGGEERMITLRGRMTGVEGQQKTFGIFVEKLAPRVGGEAEVWDIQRFEDPIVLSKPPLSVSILSNNSSNYTTGVGQTIDYRIIIKNDSPATFSNMRVSVAITGSMFDLDYINTTGLLSPDGRSIMFDATTQQALGVLPAGQTIELPLGMRVKNALPPGRSPGPDDLLLSAVVNSPSVPSGIAADAFPVRADSRVRIAAGPSFAGAVVYTHNDWTTEGPLPPEVGSETRFIVRLRILSPTDGLSGGIVKAKLGAGVKWLNRISINAPQAQPIQYDERLNTLQWNVGAIPASVTAPVEAAFMVAVTPALNQSRQSLVLLQDVSLDARNDVTRQPLQKFIRSLNTENIEGFSGGGRVR